jgi:hypothetical protein
VNRATVFRHLSVERTPEVLRIARLPRRAWDPGAAEDLATRLTRELKTPGGTMHLRPVQAISLYEAMECRGLFGPQRVGAGKTLVTLLLPLVLESKRPILLLPAALIRKTWNDRKMLAEHWRLPSNLQFLSYEMLGLVQSANRLAFIQPDLIIADECHYLKNSRAGRTRRVARYMHDRPLTSFAALSGTIMKASVTDFAPLLRWALKDKAPIPKTVDETQSWADALDEEVNPLVRRKPTVFFDFGRASAGGGGENELTLARQAFQARLIETRGVVASAKNDDVACSLRIDALEYKPSTLTEQHFDFLRKNWITPDGWSFQEALEFRMYLRQLALGFHSIWDPRPPQDWIAARREWFGFVRETLQHSRVLDTPLQVTNGVDNGTIRGGTFELAAWRKIKDTFRPNPKDVWHDDTALETCASWMERQKGIVWTSHVFFAERLARMTGAKYYGADGETKDGENILNVKSGRAIIASIPANSTGRNLQMFSTNLITSCPSGKTAPAIFEQLIGRTHRDGQRADEVTVDILLGCGEHHEGFMRALDGARAAADMMGHDQKILLADLAFPISISERKGPLWG